MQMKPYPVIDAAATGNKIRQLRVERGLSVRDLQGYFGFEEPRAIYKWQKGESLPTVDNLYALGALLEVPLEQILVPMTIVEHIQQANEQQINTCCSDHLWRYWVVRYRDTGGGLLLEPPGEWLCAAHGYSLAERAA